MRLSVALLLSQMSMAGNRYLPLAIVIPVWVVWAYTSGVAAVVHIAPNAASCGDVENCTSLSEYAQMLSSNSSVSTDLVFLPGNHFLNASLLISGASDVALLGDCSNNETCPLITCSNIFLGFENVTRTVITNLRFVNCLVVIAPNIDSLAIVPNVLILSSQITNCSFSHIARSVLVISGSNVNIKDCSFANITSERNAAVIVQYSIAHFSGNNTFTNNIAVDSSLGLFQTNVTFSDNTLFHNNIGSAGGSLSMYNGHAIFNGNAVFRLSYSSFIGALYAYNSTISFYGETLFEQNSADHIGALGGGVSSRFDVFGNLTFYNNTATQLAGGLGLTYASQIYLAQGSNVIFELNRADFEGGAIYVEDASFCFSTPGPCFFQVMDVEDPRANLIFINNFANVGGDDIYGGGIDSCMINNDFFLSTLVFDRIATFHHDNPTISTIASDATQVCECVNDVPVCQPTRQCTVDTPELCTLSRTIYPGENILVTVAAVGQRGGIVPGGIRALTNTLNFNLGRQIPFSDYETIRGINATCTTLSYTVTSTDPVQILSLYPRASLCLNTDIPLPIALFFIQPCPYGFQTDQSTGACICEERLINIGDITCNITHTTFQHHGEHWIGFDNSSKELILHEGSCPFDYCITNQEVSFTLNDTQKECSFNHSGLLCGACQNGLSILLGGTSRCESCSNAYLSLLIPFAIAGVALVVLLFVCELNVVAGTLSGLIFYANVVQINRALFFKSNNVLTIFIAWLNLDLGIETCFYDGMDTYGKTWLQFLFPFYIWAIVGLIILLSSYSKRVTKVLGSHPIAVLATLFLLSYVKILRVFISVVSFTTLDYPSRTAIVWNSDANVGYLQGKHIPLFLAAVLIFLLLFVPYTLLLLFGQWFQTKTHWKFMAWAKSQRLKAFLDVYHAPYKDQHRYWPGLLLLFRIALAIANATAAESLLSVTYAVIVTVLLVQLWGWTARGVYKKWPLDTLEAVFFVNLGLLIFATYHIDSSGGNQMAAISTSVSFTLLVFVGILLYHILILRLKLEKASAEYWVRKIKMSNKEEAQTKEQVQANLSPLNVSTNTGPVTVSYVSFRELLLEEDPN